jgi:predicted HicB family RNase H-like nuclease
MKYKGYRGHAVYDPDVKIFHGEVIGLDAVITFQGKTVNELEKAFKDSIDDYLEWCQERGKKPEKTFSGMFSLRLSPELHEILAHNAITQNMSLNAYLNTVLREATKKI